MPPHAGDPGGRLLILCLPQTSPGGLGTADEGPSAAVVVRIVALVDTVRNRILDFVLEMEAAAPDAGEAKPGTKPVADAKVGQIFNTHVMSGNTVVGGTVTNVQQTRVAEGDLSSLKTHLLSLGVERNDVRALEKAIKGDPRPKEPGKFGGGVSAWMGRMVAKAASGAWSSSTKAAADVLSRLLCSYYGLS
jgi:hypothetical protein